MVLRWDALSLCVVQAKTERLEHRPRLVAGGNAGLHAAHQQLSPTATIISVPWQGLGGQHGSAGLHDDAR